MPDQDEQGQFKGAWVPQLFYDIIGRLAPGAILIGVFSISISGPNATSLAVGTWLNKGSEDYPPVTLILFVGILLSYIVSILLLGVWSLADWIGLLFWPRKPMTIQLFGMKWRVKSREEILDSRKEFSKKYDFIKTHDPVAGSRMTKLHAEIHMSGILVLGFVISLIINLCKMNPSSDDPRVFLAILLSLSAIGGIGSLRHLISTQKGAIENYCKLLGYYEKKAKAAPR